MGSETGTRGAPGPRSSGLEAGRFEPLFFHPGDGTSPFVIRPPEPGDLGWVVERHGVLYAQEYGWGFRLEALVAGVVAGFVESFDPGRERFWIAERNGRKAGSVCLVRKAGTSAEVAKLRLLFLEPEARGLGLGTRLIDLCVSFAREAGYKTVTLWTHNILTAARRAYARAGFHLVSDGPISPFGTVEETWELDLVSAGETPASPARDGA